MDRKRLGEYVTAARRAHFRTVENAVRASGLNRVTWQRVEAGDGVRDDTLIKVAESLGWDANDPWRIAAGLEPLAEPETPPVRGGRLGALRAHVESAELPDYARRAILGILDALDDAGDDNGSKSKGA